jgi:hypothetical protein
MSNTPNYNLYKPSAGDSGWADEMNQNLNTIDAQMKSNADAVINHNGNGSNKHLANQIRTADGSNVETKIANLDSAKANTNHSHSGYASMSHIHSQYALSSDLEKINNTLDLLLPNLTSIDVSASISNRSGGIRIIGITTPVINVSSWRLIISKNSIVCFEMISSGSYMFVQEEAMTGVQDDDVIDIEVSIISGESIKSKTYSHQFQHINSNIKDRVMTLESQLTIGNVIDSFAQDTDALQALANVLHSSNTLAQKVAELNR